jgi:hypothetical protein
MALKIKKILTLLPEKFKRSLALLLNVAVLKINYSILQIKPIQKALKVS